MKSSRGVSQVLQVALILALTVSFAYVAFRYVGDFEVSKPTFVKIKIDKVTEGNGKIYHDQVVILRHIAGDPLKVKDVKILLTVLHGGKVESCTLQNFPWKFGVGINKLPDDSVVGDDLIDENPNHYSRYLGEIGYKSDGIWSQGETVGFRIKKEGVKLIKGDKIEIAIIYKGSTVAEDSITVC